MLKLAILAFALFGAVLGGNGRLSPSLLSSLEGEERATYNIMVSFEGPGTSEIAQTVESLSFPTRTEKIQQLKGILEAQADHYQVEARAFLIKNKVSFKSFWITNQISIRGATKDIILSLGSVKNVKSVDLEKKVRLPKPVEGPTPVAATPRGAQGLNWGTDMIKAQEAWRISNGSGVIVANIDSGVRQTHEALRTNYAGEYGWLDAVAGRDSPYDDQGHGTHVMGTIAGTAQEIGIAPGAKWMACKGWGDWEFGWQSYLIACGEWLVCPTKANGTDPDCSKAPVVVANSWGDEPDATENWFQPVTDAWIAAGIIPIFASGNSGPSCGSVDGPGDTTRVIGVGATNANDELASFSSVGPTTDGRMKPEVSAPGQAIPSASYQSDTGYLTFSGTSMATPHIAGTVGLLKSLRPNLTYEQVKSALMAAVDTNLVFRNTTCGGRSDNQFPNNHFGSGRINALKLVQAAAQMN